MKFAKRVDNMKASEIREILKITARPEVISFAGGLPAPELFPMEAIKRVSRLVLDEFGPASLQYAPTEGFLPLRQWIAGYMAGRGMYGLSEDSILVTSGSQQCLDLVGKIFLDKGDLVACESPTYLAAITAFRAYECRFAQIATDDEGMNLDSLRDSLAAGGVKLIYIIPDFQNPTGRTWSRERREGLARLAAEFDVPVLEDNPYGDLRFEGEHLPAVASFDTDGHVLHTGTFSKIFCPGHRIGWIVGAADLVHKLVLAKQGTDLQSGTLAQMEIAKYLELYDIQEHIENIRRVYRQRRNVMMGEMEKSFPASVSFTRPQGGLFAWATLPREANARDILMECLKQNVAFVPGGAFFPGGGHENTFRLNFSNMPEERIVEGIRRLGKVLHAHCGSAAA